MSLNMRSESKANSPIRSTRQPPTLVLYVQLLLTSVGAVSADQGHKLAQKLTDPEQSLSQIESKSPFEHERSSHRCMHRAPLTAVRTHVYIGGPNLSLMRPMFKRAQDQIFKCSAPPHWGEFSKKLSSHLGSYIINTRFLKVLSTQQLLLWPHMWPDFPKGSLENLIPIAGGEHIYNSDPMF